MNNKISITYLILSIVAFFFGCRGPVPVKEENKNNASASSVSPGQKYVTKVESVNVRSKTIKVTGNLTIKGITNSVTFPAEIEVKDGIVKANGKVVIDRTQWGIRYRSGKFYDNLADNAVSDDIEIRMKIVAKK